jgi:carbonic anhydrase
LKSWQDDYRRALSQACLEGEETYHFRISSRACSVSQLGEQGLRSKVASDVFVQEVWARRQDLWIHGWVYSLANGLVTDLDISIGRPKINKKRLEPTVQD